MEPWKNPELEGIALRVARLVTGDSQAKWDIFDALHELDGRISTAPKIEMAESSRGMGCP